MVAQVLSSEDMNRIVSTYSGQTSVPTLPQTRLLRMLSTVQRDMLDKMMSERPCQRGELVFVEGERGDTGYLIWSGRVAIFKGDTESFNMLGLRGAGEFIGEMALLEERPRSASAVALDNVRLLEIGRADFQQLLDQSDAFRDMIMETLSSRLREADEALVAGRAAEEILHQQVSTVRREQQELQELRRLRQEANDWIVHDLRNPLHTNYGIIQVLEMVLPAEVLEANRELLTVAESACRRMQRMIDSLLDTTKLETGDAALNLVKVDLKALLEEVCVQENYALDRKQITLNIALPDKLPMVLVDAEQMDRVVAHLLDHAVTGTPHGGHIELAAEVAEGQLLISLTDAGPNISPSERETIFEQTSGGRSGPKLYFCRLAVEAHGGGIQVEPGPSDVGNRFVISLPVLYS